MLSGIGGSVNVDLVVRGHSHDLETKPKTRLELNRAKPPEFVERKTYFVSNGSLLRSYVKGHESYAELKNMKPNALMWGEAELMMVSNHGTLSARTRISYS
jgi:predicted phosphodiesterase